MTDLIMSPLNTWWAKSIIGIVYFVGLIAEVFLMVHLETLWAFLVAGGYAVLGTALLMLSIIAGAERFVRESGSRKFWEQERRLREEISPQRLHQISKEWR